MRLTQLAIGALALGLIAAPAWAQDDETTSEDELTRSSTSLNSDSLRGRSQSLNSLDAGKADEALAWMERYGGAFEAGSPQQLDAKVWVADQRLSISESAAGSPSPQDTP